MSKYKLSNIAKEDLIRIHHYGVKQFGIKQADKYFESFFDYFELIAKNPHLFESVDFIKPGYRRCVCGVDSIFFKANGDFVEIMTIIGRQDLNQLI
ncbi:type II toxin-antitoxin system RelE/ParE family toxin [uncultured Fluviicola sp.]|uniref:type II toxin-antitoxin system RelE/ParE family toxin n=1 Tax=uncultured Fluviicola sp. TaxID=463303 RepID=UPI0025DD254B|nr:type II toxin-antitoxin system RelE/ParE family toxin [uncultured Fluviicola sp.]